MYTASSKEKELHSRETGRGLNGSIRWRKAEKNFNLHTTRCDYWAALQSPWRPSGSPGERPRGYKEEEREEGKWWQLGEGSGKGSNEETRGGRRGCDGGEGPGREVRGKRGLSTFDGKSLRREHSGAECCTTCAGNPQCQRQHGDGEDEGREIKKNRHGENKMRKSQET